MEVIMRNILDGSKLKQKIDPVELISELRISNTKKKATTRVHELIHLMTYKICSKIIMRISKMQYEYDDFVNDVYIYAVAQALKFDITKEGSSAFSYFTSVINNQIICLTKKHYLKYNAKKDYMEELRTEIEIDMKTGIYR